LRRSDFMDQMQIDVEQGRLPFGRGYYMRVPDFVE